MKRVFLVFSMVSCLVATAPLALAQGADGLDCERFKPAVDSQGVILTEGGQGELSGDLNLGFYFHFSHNPLVITSDGEIRYSLVSDRLAGDFFVSMGVLDWLTLGVSVPAVFYQDGKMFNATTGAGMGLTSGTLGDIRVVPKFTVLRENTFGVSLAVVVPFSLPSGDDGAYSGSKSVTLSPMIAASRHLLDDRLLLAANLGFWIQADDAQYHDLEADQEMFYRLGAGFLFAKDWWALGELAGAARLKTMFENKPRETPLECLLGIRHDGPYDLHFTLGGAVGSLPGWGTPNFRAFLGVSWAPREHDKDGDGIIDRQDKCPNDPGPRDNNGCPWGDEDSDGLKDNQDKCPKEAGPVENKGCPWGDRDEDGIKDNQDQCPEEAGPVENKGCPWGDRDEDGIKDNLDQCPDEAGPEENGGCPWGDQDEDGLKDNQDKCPGLFGPADNHGCPRGDEDGDGIKDKRDKCPKQPGPTENQGCPWGDADKDGILDNLDKCPKQPEDLDEFEDDDGCPDKDNDKDGVPDDQDKCPNVPETINGYKDEDGCPDKGRQVVIVRKEKIEILQKVHFAYGRARIKPDSFGLLDQVAQVLKGHEEIKKIRIEGHTDSRGSDAANRRLSQRRAGAVRKYLIKRGVASKRLKAVGYGEAKPIASNKSDTGRESNRRVEFVIIENR
jgi:outer membrane protein OmpA-like peptidoglycan-associated protein